MASKQGDITTNLQPRHMVHFQIDVLPGAPETEIRSRGALLHQLFGFAAGVEFEFARIF
jgi:hypothetical protein